MKTLAIIVIAIWLFSSGSIDINLDFADLDTWQWPLWIADLSWTGMEFLGAVLAIIAVVAGVVLFTLGLLGAGIIALIAVVIAMLFGSVAMLWPLLIVAGLCWLISDNSTA